MSSMVMVAMVMVTMVMVVMVMVVMMDVWAKLTPSATTGGASDLQYSHNTVR